jgi:hypothetical protein
MMPEIEAEAERMMPEVEAEAERLHMENLREMEHETEGLGLAPEFPKTRQRAGNARAERRSQMDAAGPSAFTHVFAVAGAD